MKPLIGYNTSNRSARDVFGEMPRRKLVKPPKLAPTASTEAAAVPTSSLRLNAAAIRPNSSAGVADEAGPPPPPPSAEERTTGRERGEEKGKWRGEIIRAVGTEPMPIAMFASYMVRVFR